MPVQAKKMQSADALEDDFDLDPLVGGNNDDDDDDAVSDAASDAALSSAHEDASHASNSDDDADPSDSVDGEGRRAERGPRVRTSGEASDRAEAAAATRAAAAPASAASKEKKRKALEELKSRQKEEKRRRTEETRGVLRLGFLGRDAARVADAWTAAMRKDKGATELEVAQAQLDPAWIATPDFKPRRSNFAYPQFVAAVAGDLPQPPKKPKLHKPGHQARIGAPYVLVVTASAVRAVDVVRALRDTYTCAKLFAKHFKLDEQIEMLGKSTAQVGVGTPARLMQLMLAGAATSTHNGIGGDDGQTKVAVVEGAGNADNVDETDKADKASKEFTPPRGLLLHNLALIVVDVSHVDAKDRTFFEIPEVRKDMRGLFLSEPLAKRLASGKCQVAFY